MRDNLRNVRASIERREGNAANALTRMHFEDMLDEINAILEG